jgi:hypothetical protein
VFGSDKLMREGVQAQALVLDQSVYSQGVQTGEVKACRYRLRVRFEDGSTTEISRSVWSHNLAYATVGDLIPVRYDPADRSKIEIDGRAINAQRAAEASELKQQVLADGEAKLARGGTEKDAVETGPGAAGVADPQSVPPDMSATIERLSAATADFSETMAAIKRAKSAGGTAEVERLKAEFASRAADGTTSAGQAAGGVTPHGVASDPLERLQKLADLHDRGVLTDVEFAAEKAKILGE